MATALWVRTTKHHRIDKQIVEPCTRKDPQDALENALATNLPILVFEQNVASGTLYSKILEYKEEHGYTNKIFFHGFKPGIEITFGSLDEVYSHYGWSDSEFINFIKEKLSW